LTGSTDKTAKLWDVSTGQVVNTYSGHSKAITGVAFSPDDNFVVTGSQDRTAKLWHTGITADAGSAAPLNVNAAVKWTSPDGTFSTLLPPGWSVAPAGELDSMGMTSITLTNTSDSKRNAPVAMLTFAVGSAAQLMKGFGSTHSTLDADIKAIHDFH